MPLGLRRMPQSQNALVKKLSGYLVLSGEEESRLSELQSKPVRVKGGQELLQEGHVGRKVFIIQSGWASSYKDLPDGGRQIISFPVAGDCVGLRSVLLRTSDHSFSALTDAQLHTIDAAPLMQLFDDFPRIRAGFLWSAARDEAMAVEHLVSVGRRSALQRTAHFFMELAERLALVGLATETHFKCPLNQYVLADALGLSAIHVNRVLRVLREQKLLTIRTGTVVIHDLAGLRRLASYKSVNPDRI